MSGRLIILPKKSWHVGKRENIEKVMRDERLAAEAATAAREREREITQEGIVETLKRRSSAGEDVRQHTADEKSRRKRKSKDRDDAHNADGAAGTNQGWGGKWQHVNFFSEAEREADKQLGQNEEYEEEKRQQDLLAQRRSGLAPTAFGEGAAELKDKDSKPWYQLQASHSDSTTAARTIRLGREVTGKEAEGALERDGNRKVRQDPMGTLLHSAVQVKNLPLMSQPGVLHPRVESCSADDDRCEFGTPIGRQGDSEDSRSVKKKAKKAKKDRKDSKAKRRERRMRKRSVDQGADTHGAGTSARGGSSCELEDHNRRQKLEQLRKKRLSRERDERRREVQLLAEREMAGRPVPDERSMAYNNQYNAQAARRR